MTKKEAEKIDFKAEVFWAGDKGTIYKGYVMSKSVSPDTGVLILGLALENILSGRENSIASDRVFTVRSGAKQLVIDDLIVEEELAYKGYEAHKAIRLAAEKHRDRLKKEEAKSND